MRRVTTLGRRFDIGLGWCRPRKARAVEPPFVEHLGGGLGIFNTMRLYPEREVGVVVMANTPGYDREAIVATALSMS